MNRCEMESQIDDLKKLLILMQNNQDSPSFIYFFENSILSLREPSYLMEKYFYSKLDLITKQKINTITKARNAICHRSSPLNFINIEK